MTWAGIPFAALGAFRRTLAMAAQFEEWRMRLVAYGFSAEEAAEIVRREGLAGIESWLHRYLTHGRETR